MIPSFTDTGELPPGIHPSSWQEVTEMLAWTVSRKKLLRGLERGLENLKSAGCETTYLDGSFATHKDEPADFDVCWEVAGVQGRLLDPVLLTFAHGRAAQKAKYYGEFFPAEAEATPDGLRYLDFFQINRLGQAKGIIKLDLKRWNDDNQWTAIPSHQKRSPEVCWCPCKLKAKTAWQAQLEAMQSQLEDLERDLADYDALKRRERTEFSTHSLVELPLGLIQARISQGLTQEQLAEKLGVPKQQVQRDEDNLYASANLQRLAKVAEVLGVKLDARLELVWIWQFRV
jgi:DNA-binding XRE family transcriptional regulator